MGLGSPYFGLYLLQCNVRWFFGRKSFLGGALNKTSAMELLTRPPEYYTPNPKKGPGPRPNQKGRTHEAKSSHEDVPLKRHGNLSKRGLGSLGDPRETGIKGGSCGFYSELCRRHSEKLIEFGGKGLVFKAVGVVMDFSVQVLDLGESLVIRVGSSGHFCLIADIVSENVS